MKYAYVRVSTTEQGDSGVGRAAQEIICAEIGKKIGDEWGEECYAKRGETIPGFFVDEVSSFRVPLISRDAGSKLLAVLQPGDTVVMARLDRGFRSLLDFCKFLHLCRTNNWKIVCKDCPFDLNTANGRAVAKFYVQIAEWSSEMQSDRIKEGLAAKKAGIANGKSKRTREESLPSDWRPEEKPPAKQSVPQESGRVICYVRCSHRSSVESGHNLVHAMTACMDYADQLLEKNPSLRMHPSPIMTDPAVSARSKKLGQRNYGKKLLESVRAGDHIVVLRPDRVFANIHDMSDTLRELQARKVTLHFAESALDTSSIVGEVILSVLVSFAKIERELISSRNKEAYSALVSQGKYAGGRRGYAPLFWRIIRVGGAKRLIMDYNQIMTYKLMQNWRQRGMYFQKMLARMEAIIAKRENRPEIPEHGVMRVGRYKKLPPEYQPVKQGGFVYPLWTMDKLIRGWKVWERTWAMWKAMTPEQRRYCKKHATTFRLVRVFNTRRKMERNNKSRFRKMVENLENKVLASRKRPEQREASDPIESGCRS